MNVGRSRGRGRTEGTERSTESESTSSTEEGAAGGAEEPAMRGRGGFRVAETLRTIPPGVSETCGDNQGSLRIVSNFFQLKVPTDQVVYSYRVDFDPQVESVRVRRGLVYEMKDVFNAAYVFDGGNEIKSLAKIDEATRTGTRKSDSAVITMHVKHTSVVSWGHPEMLRLYNTQMRRNLEHLGFIQVGRDYYDKSARKIMREQDVEVWPGISTAINEHDGGILMCSDMINKVIRNETALDMLRRILQRDRDNMRSIARRELPGAIVMTKYNHKTYRIDDVIFDKNPSSYTFDRRGQTISLAQYYQEQYSMKCEDERQPLLLVKPTERQKRGGEEKEIMLIPEFCLMTGLNESQRNDFNFKRALGEITRLDPTKKAQNLIGFMRKMLANEKVREEMSAWKLGFEDKLVEINCRNLPPEKIQTFGDVGDKAGVPYLQHTGNFEKEIRSKKMKKPAKIENWCLIAIRRDKSTIDEFFACMRKVCGPLGIDIGPPRMYPIDSDRPSAYLEACRSIPPEAKMVICVVPNTQKERYDVIKKHFCCEAPCPSQVITTKVLSNKKTLMSVSTKILIQMATKVGAEPWGLNIPPKATMIIGYDTYHDSERKGHSVGGFVCSTNSSATSWFSRTSYHQNREELCGNFASNMRAGLKNWQQVNGSWPARIVIYRDGVSEGQIQHVYDVEMKQMQQVLKEKEGLDKAAFTFVIVTKRINARFFLAGESRDLRNPPPGTLIDAVITRKERFDFYLISQSVRQGTVNPTMFNIIADSTGWKPVHHQQLAYKLCHLYYNWAGTITVPAPCQYAHKLAYLTGTSLHKEHHLSLSHTLFFL